MKNDKGKGALIIKADGTSAAYIPNDGRKLTGDEMRKIVGGYIQIVSDGKFAIVIDEDGKPKGCRPNLQATTLARAMKMIHPTDYIVGDVILCPKSMAL